MSVLLRIDASARKDGSVSRAMADEFEARWREVNPEGRVIRRDLAVDAPPHLTADCILGFFTPEADRTAAQREAVRLSDEWVAELETADVVLVSSAMYNFAPPSALKAYVDQIVRYGRTFAYENGAYRGLLDARKVACVITANGGVYSEPAAQALDFHTPYLEMILRFIGFQTVEALRIEGATTDAAALERSREAARIKIKALAGRAPASVS
jgi:FMN-dependent NADH-azoreductase